MNPPAGKRGPTLTSLFSDDVDRLAAVAPDAGISAVRARNGAVVLEWSGRALDSRRDPVKAAETAAADVTADDSVIVIGFGAGYLVEALCARGICVQAVVDHAAVFEAARRGRGLSPALQTVPIVTVEGLTDRARLSQLRALTTTLVMHAPSVTASVSLQSLCEAWDRVPRARPPRVLVVGPIAGGSLEVARSVHRAAGRLGADARLFAADGFDGAQRAFDALPVSREAHTYLRGKFALLLGEALVESADAFRPDLVLAIAQAPLSESSLTALRQRGMPSAFWFVENTRVLPYWRDVARYYDRFYSIQPGQALDAIRAAGAPFAAYLPMAADPEFQVLPELTEAERRHFGSALSFAGAPYLNRRHVLAAVADLDLKVWGDGWEATALAGRLGRRGRFDLDTMRRVFAATAINLNVHSADHITGLDPDPDYVNPRTFELAMAGAFQLVDCRDSLHELFADDEMATFGSVAELRAKALHFIAHRDEARHIAGRAQARARRDHSYDNRVATIFADALPAHLQPGALAMRQESLAEALSAAGTDATMTEREVYLRMLIDIRETQVSR